MATDPAALTTMIDSRSDAIVRYVRIYIAAACGSRAEFMAIMLGAVHRKIERLRADLLGDVERGILLDDIPSLVPSGLDWFVARKHTADGFVSAVGGKTRRTSEGDTPSLALRAAFAEIGVTLPISPSTQHAPVAASPVVPPSDVEAVARQWQIYEARDLGPGHHWGVVVKTDPSKIIARELSQVQAFDDAEWRNISAALVASRAKSAALQTSDVPAAPPSDVEAVARAVTSVKGNIAVEWAINQIVTDVADFSDRNSPEDQPEMMLITGQELADKLREFLETVAPMIVSSALAASRVTEMRTLLERLDKAFGMKGAAEDRKATWGIVTEARALLGKVDAT